MNKYLLSRIKKEKAILNDWTKNHITGLFVFNLFILLMVLLSSAQYFKPFFYLGINSIFFLSLIFAVVLLGARVKTMFIISIVFLLFSAFLKVVKIDIWADRASIYYYQSLLIGLVLLLISKK